MIEQTIALYDAFICYRQAKDKPIAAALQRGVQTSARPRLGLVQRRKRCG
jgi:hypothetical protein